LSYTFLDKLVSVTEKATHEYIPGFRGRYGHAQCRQGKYQVYYAPHGGRVGFCPEAGHKHPHSPASFQRGDADENSNQRSTALEQICIYHLLRLTDAKHERHGQKMPRQEQQTRRSRFGRLCARLRRMTTFRHLGYTVSTCYAYHTKSNIMRKSSAAISTAKLVNEELAKRMWGT